MKNIISLLLSIVMLCSLTASSGSDADTFATNQLEIRETTTVDLVNYVPNLLGRTPKNINTWSVDVVTNYIPFTHTKNLFFLECKDSAGNDQHYYLDIDLHDTICDANVVDTTSEKALIKAGCYLFTYAFDSKQCETITKDALDYNFDDYGKLYFTDWSHNEYVVCDWTNSVESTKTDKQVVHYFNDNFDLEVDETFTSDFKTIQKALRDGIANDSSFKNNYVIDSFGNIYDTSGYYLSNIHLPKPYIDNNNVIYSDSFGCWLTNYSTITYYRYGYVVRRYKLGSGPWKIISTDIEYQADTDSGNWIGYDMDTNHDNNLTAIELNFAISSVQILLYNSKNQSIYISYDGNRPIRLTENVVDYCEANGQLYWMNANLEAYELSWRKTMASVLIGKNVVGISHYTDERAGFVVAPDDHRCNVIDGGTSLCTLYGKEWLNQNQTSGAWALELDWD